MKCPNDQTEMEKGALATGGTRWSKPFNGFQKIFAAAPGPEIIAYKCPTCGKVELKVESKS